MCETPTLKATVYKCHNSDEYYTARFRLGYQKICSEDPHFYQLCGGPYDGKIINGELLCGGYLCETKGAHHYILTNLTQEHMNVACDGKYDCVNTKLDEEGCSEMTTMPSGKLIATYKICDEKCDSYFCEDEANCNGYTYGRYCSDHSGTIWYLPAYRVCIPSEKRLCVKSTVCDVNNDTENSC